MSNRREIYFRDEITAAMRTAALHIASLPAHERATAMNTLAIIGEALSVEPDEIAPRNFVVYQPKPERVITHIEPMPRYSLPIRTEVRERG